MFVRLFVCRKLFSQKKHRYRRQVPVPCHFIMILMFGAKVGIIIGTAKSKIPSYSPNSSW